MKKMLIPGLPLNITDLRLEHLPVPAAQVAEGAPTTGLHDLGRLGDLGVGVWEMSTGSMNDTEADEVFLVVSGSATVEFHQDDAHDAAGTSVPLAPGSLMLLSAGMRTTWTVHETLRKLYLTREPEPSDAE